MEYSIKIYKWERVEYEKYNRFKVDGYVKK